MNELKQKTIQFDNKQFHMVSYALDAVYYSANDGLVSRFTNTDSDKRILDTLQDKLAKGKLSLTQKQEGFLNYCIENYFKLLKQKAFPALYKTPEADEATFAELGLLPAQK